MLTYLGNFLLIIIMLFSGCMSDDGEIRVMTWNIWHGGIHGEKSNNFIEDSLNTINTVHVISENDPDILLMQETYCCGMEIAKAAGFQYSWRASSNLSIHSKFPIIDTINIYKPFNSHGIKIRNDRTELYLFNIWLHYLPNYYDNSRTKTSVELIENENQTRLAEIKSILKEIKSVIGNSKDVPVIIGGDFNSGSHLDWTEITKDNHYGKVVEWPVSKEMENYSFKDSFREIYPDPFSKPGVTWGGFLFDNMMSDRIDYIYYKGEKIKAVDSKVIGENNSGGIFNSDHRAVITTFILL